GTARRALDTAVEYAKERVVWRETPIGAHQGLSHPLAQIKIELEQARLMTQFAALRYDSGDDAGAGEAANMAKYAAAEACVRAVDQSVQTLGGNGLASEYGLGAMIASARLARIAPVSREMILNYVAQQSLGLPTSYCTNTQWGRGRKPWAATGNPARSAAGPPVPDSWRPL